MYYYVFIEFHSVKELNTMARISRKNKAKKPGRRGRPSKSSMTVSVKNSGNSLVKDLIPKDSDYGYYGAEPNFADGQSVSITRAYNWYSHFYGMSDAKQFLVTYLESIKSDKTKTVKKIPDNKMITTVGWLARMATRGLVLTEEQRAYMNDTVTRMVSRLEQEKEAKEASASDDKPAPSRANIQEIMREKARDTAGEIDDLFDSMVWFNDCEKDFFVDDHVYTPMELLKRSNILPQHVGLILKRWTNIRSEFEEVLKGTDAQLNEAYASYSKKQMKNKLQFTEEVIKQLNDYVSLKQATKKVRVRKPIPVEKLVKRLKYCKTFTDTALKLELVSLSPTKLVGASEAFLYDTKKRKLTYLVADDYSKTLTVQGSKIIGFDKNKSQTKGIRKPSEKVNELMKAGRPASRKLFDNIKAVSVIPKGKTNNDVIILKVW